MAGDGVEGMEMAVEAAVQGVRQLLLQGEKGDGSSATAAQHCRVLVCVCNLNRQIRESWKSDLSL